MPTPPPARLTATVERAGERVQLLRCRGEFDIAGIPAFKRAAAQASADYLVIDLTDVCFMDSTALGQLLAIRRRYPEPRLAISCHLGELVHRVMKISSTDTLFALYPTTEQAIAALTPP